MKRLFTVLAVLVGVALAPGIAVADDAADRDAIRRATEGALKAAQAKDVARWATFYADDAMLFPPNATIVSGKEAIQKLLAEYVADPNFNVTWQTTNVKISADGGMGYASGTYEGTSNDEEGNPVTDRGKWVAVYKKKADGTWKCVADIWNSDKPLA